MKVKILEIHCHEYSRDDYCDGIYALHDMTDWDDVSEEDFKVLLNWAQVENAKYGKIAKYVLITDKNISVPKTIKAYLNRAKMQELEKAERERKQKEAQEKRDATIKKKQEAKQKKLLEELKAKFGET